jgi:hypothetical protein
MSLIRTAGFCALLGLVLSFPALGQTVHLAEYQRQSNGSAGQSGSCVEVVDEVAKVLETRAAYEFMDWKAAQAKVRAGHDLLIFPAASRSLCG